MVLDNLSVRHKAFGIGTVISTQGKYMTVRFESGDKNFIYPDSFEKFLTLADGTISEEIARDLASALAAKKEIIDKKNQENLRSMMHGIVIPGKENMELDEEHEGDGENEEKSGSGIES